MEKYLDSSVQYLKEMLGDKSNELESGELRALSMGMQVQETEKATKAHS